MNNNNKKIQKWKEKRNKNKESKYMKNKRRR